MAETGTVDLMDFATEAAPNTSAANAETTNQDTNADGTGPDTSAPTTAPKDPKKVYPNVLRTYKATDLPEGEQPTDAYTVRQFAARLTAQNLQNMDFSAPNAAEDAFVDPQNVYTWLRSVRGPAPVVLVFPVSTEKDADGNDVEVVSDDEREATVFLPWSEASQQYATRPTRSSGGASTSGGSKKSEEELMDDASKKLAELQSAQKQLLAKQNKVNRLTTQYDKYQDLVARKFGITSDEAKAKVEAKVAEMTAAAEAAEENAAGTETTNA
jgi:hypothetical protein